MCLIIANAVETPLLITHRFALICQPAASLREGDLRENDEML